MAFTGREDHRVSLAEARAMTKRFRDAEAAAARVVRGHYVGRAVLEEILGQPGCVGLRIYHARKADGAPTLVIVGVGPEDADLTGGVIAEETWPCPPFCGPPSALADDAS